VERRRFAYRLPALDRAFLGATAFRLEWRHCLAGGVDF